MPQVTSLTEGPVARTLVRLTLPMLMAMFAMVGFNIVDTFYVGQLGTEQLAAMGFTLAVVMAVNSVSMGIGIGTTAVVSRVIGEGDVREMQRLTMDAIMLGVLVASSMSILGLSTIPHIFGLIGAEGIVLDYVREYMTVWYLGLPLIIVPQVGNSGVRATGDTKTPAKIMVTVLTVNAILDPLFIFGWGPVPGFGLRGAAIATVISQSVALIIAFNVLKRRGLITFERHTGAGIVASWRRILKIAIPAGLTQMITPVSTAVITAIVATYGVASVAGFGVATRLEMFAVMVIMALGAALVPFVGQNWGAGNKERVGRAIKVAIGIAAGWGMFVWLLFMVIGESVAGAFNSNPAVIEVVAGYMLIVFPSYMLLGALVTVTNALNALHLPLRSMVISLLRMFVLYVPLAYLGSALWGLTGVWWAAFSANVLGGLVALWWFRRTFSSLQTAVPGPTQESMADEEASAQAKMDTEPQPA